MTDIVRVAIINEPSGMTEDDAEYLPPGASASVSLRRETVSEFHDRAAAGAGAISIVFGHGQKKEQS